MVIFALITALFSFALKLLKRLHVYYVLSKRDGQIYLESTEKTAQLQEKLQVAEE